MEAVFAVEASQRSVNRLDAMMRADGERLLAFFGDKVRRASKAARILSVVDLVRAITSGAPASPSFAEAAQVQRVLAAVEDSAARGSIMTAVEGAPS